MESPLALYRRYRPETFADVIGQDHVTTPLRAALANNRVNHAYLFSGPRGCGKTTSARILARALNCDKAPVAEPCGECDSCRDLARGGPGSIDVIEIDAASHGGVDDARDLREKAFFAPVRSPYKVYIIDEAHMVTTQGFNALLKLVEEPPPHLRFIFATTEPEKVIATIRSRTHHYPFRLIPPRLLASYLSEICESEGVQIEPAALPLIVRAGAGSARDALSVLDQLLGGAGPEGVTHDLATGLLGYTPTALLDDVVDAFAAGDGAAVFGVVDRVIETGQDPRRFTEDLLRRLRDLVIVSAVPDAPATGLIDVSEDQGDRLVAQAARFGPAELSRAADLVATGLTEMRGATAPRLLLELVCARVLLPGSDPSEAGLLARVDRLEKRASIAGGPPSPAPVREDPVPPTVEHPVAPVAEPAPEPPPAPAVEDAEPAPADPDPEPAPAATVEPDPEPAPDPEPGTGVGVRGRSGAHGRAVARGDRRRADPGRGTTPLARRGRGDQAAAPGRVDAPHPELPGGGGRGQRVDPGLLQRRRPRLLPQWRLRRDPAAGRDRRRRRRLAGRVDRRPRCHQQPDRVRARHRGAARDPAGRRRPASRGDRAGCSADPHRPEAGAGRPRVRRPPRRRRRRGLRPGGCGPARARARRPGHPGDPPFLNAHPSQPTCQRGHTMTQNPFDALGGGADGGPGGGGLDLNALMQQAQQMQQQLEQAQARLADARVEGTVAGGAVTVTVNGVGELVGVDIKAGGFDGTDTDDLSDLADMIVAAYRDAKAQADGMAAEALGPLAGGGLPGLG